jgi:hypothetical protein
VEVCCSKKQNLDLHGGGWCWWRMRMNEEDFWVWETNTGFVVCKLRLSEDLESSLVYLPLSLTTWHY